MLAVTPSILPANDVIALDYRCHPIRELPSSMRFSTRTTFPSARTETSDPWVISAGSVNVISSSEPGFKILVQNEVTPLVETSRVLPFCVSATRSAERTNNYWQ